MRPTFEKIDKENMTTTEINKIKRQKKKAAKQEKKFNEKAETKSAPASSNKVEFDLEKEKEDGWTLAGSRELLKLSRAEEEDDEENYWQEDDLDDE